MLRRYRTEENRNLAETVYRLRHRGWTHQEIADETGNTLAIIIQIANRELDFRCMAFEYPFLEYIATRTAKAIKKCLGKSILGEPEKLNGMEQVKALICWPGVSDGVMKDLANGLEDAGYESFDRGKMKDAIFTTRRKAQRTRRDRFGAVEH
jgi:hypothetical protein